MPTGSDGTLDTTFSTNLGGGFGGNVWSVAAQTDGKVVVGGSLHCGQRVTSNRIARLNADGTVDAAFSANLGTGPDNDVLSVAVQTDGKIVLGGWFTALVNRTSARGSARRNTDGTGSSFSTSTGSGFDFDIHAVAISPTTSHGRRGIQHRQWNYRASHGWAEPWGGRSAPTRAAASVTKWEAVAVRADGRILVAGYLFTIDGIPSKTHRPVPMPTAHPTPHSPRTVPSV